MVHQGYHEAISELSDETRDLHRAIGALIEELREHLFTDRHTIALERGTS
jgi:hypothetical protein